MLCTMTTDHGTRLGVDPTNRTVSHRPGAHALVPLLAWRFPAGSRIVLLIADDDGAIRLHGENGPGSILSYRTAAVDGRITLQHPGTGLYMAGRVGWQPEGQSRQAVDVGAVFPRTRRRGVRRFEAPPRRGTPRTGRPAGDPAPRADAAVGRYSAIAQEVTIILGNHLTREASTYPFQAESRRWPTRSAEPPIADDVPRDVTIGSDVWIGYGATIPAGTSIGDGCIIGANAVVRGHVPPYSIYGGNPGAVVRQRFDDATVARLLKLQWWHWPDWKVDRHSARLISGGIEGFLEMAERDRQG